MAALGDKELQRHRRVQWALFQVDLLEEGVQRRVFVFGCLPWVIGSQNEVGCRRHVYLLRLAWVVGP
jgi:hypothetical protein